MNWQGVILPTVIPLIVVLATKFFDRSKDKATADATTATSDKTKIDANVALTESNLRGALEAATRSDIARADSEKARDGCRQSLIRSLDLNDLMADAFELFLDKAEEKAADDEDYADVHATLRSVRREIRELRP